jgi:hypothetical protein
MKVRTILLEFLSMRVLIACGLSLFLAACQYTQTSQVSRGPAKGSLEWAVQGCYNAGITSGEPLKQCLEGLTNGSRREVVESSPSPIFVNVPQGPRHAHCSTFQKTTTCHTF